MGIDQPWKIVDTCKVKVGVGNEHAGRNEEIDSRRKERDLILREHTIMSTTYSRIEIRVPCWSERKLSLVKVVDNILRYGLTILHNQSNVSSAFRLA